MLERGKTSGRSDDNIETILKRFRTFQEDSVPVLDVFRRSGKLRVVSTVPPKEQVRGTIVDLFTAAEALPPFQRTLGIIKPDAVAKGVIPDILDAIANDGLAVVHTMFVVMNEAVISEFYAEHTSKSFFPTLRNFMKSGRINVMFAMISFQDIQYFS